MGEFYFVICTNDKTDDQRIFVAYRESDAYSIKASFIQYVRDLEDWNVYVFRGDEV